MTKTFHRAQKQKEPNIPLSKNLTISPESERMERIKEASFAEGRKAGFGEGIQYIVNQVENILCKELGFNTREELIKSGKMPAVWIAALINAFGEDYEERIKQKAKEASEPRPRGR